MAIRKITKNHAHLTDEAKKTYLTAATTGGSDSTLTVQSIKEFANDQILLLGEFGQEKSEIVKVHTSTSPSGSTITLTGTLTFDHSVDTPVYIINYDQVEFSHADTESGSKSSLSTEDIEAEELETTYQDSTKSAGYYFTRYKDSINTTYSAYSDSIPYGGFDANTVYAIKDRAINNLGKKYSGWLTMDWLNERLWEARRTVYNTLKRWSWMQEFDYDLGTLSTGQYRISLPTDLKDVNTPKNIVGVRIGTNQNLDVITKREMDEEWRGTARTTLASAYTVGDATITLTDSGDFDDSGSIEIDEDTIEYSANNRSTGVLTVSADGSSAHSADDNIYQNVSFSLPTKYTIYEGYIYFNYPLDSDYNNYNCWLDYYKEMTAYTDEGDVLDEPEYDFYVNYLMWAIKAREKQGKLGTNDKDYQLFLSGLNSMVRKEQSGQEISLIPEIEHLEDE